MFYYFYSIFDINIFQYISVRAAIAFFIGFTLVLFGMPKYILWTQKRGTNQPISEFAPKNHKQKTNTPTMGGVIFVVSTIIGSLICAKLDNEYVIFGILSIVLFCLVGVKDDISKVLQQKNAGMSAKTKLFLQCAIAFFISCGLYLIGLESSFYVPFMKNPLWHWGLFVIFFWIVVFIATSNAVNLTDGLDGLVAIPSIYAITTLGLLVYIAGHSVFSSYLLLPKIIGSGEVAIVASALVGSLIGFLWYNCHPAQVFMGDSGSLALGGFIAYMAIISKNEILLFLIGFIFVIEALSVILQIGSYKTRGKRIFLMAPLNPFSSK